MSIIFPRPAQLFWMVMFFVTTYAFMYLAKKGKIWKVRRIAGIDAIDDAMGRATEMNRPVAYFIGEGDLSGSEGSQTVASMAILSYVARLAARFNTPFYVTIAAGRGEMAVVLADICRAAFVAEGKEDKWNPTYSVRSVGGQGTQNYLYCMALFNLEHIAVNLMFGSMGIESLPMSEEASRLGAMGIAGTARISNAPFLLACNDYVILGDEFFAGAAYISEDPNQIGTINTSDLFKIISLIIMLIGITLYVFRIDIIRTVYP